MANRAGERNQATAMVGRQVELDQLIAAMRGEANGALVVGDRGVGKSALARQVADAAVRSAHRSGTRQSLDVVTATASTSAMPLAAFAHLLPPSVPTFDPAQAATSIFPAVTAALAVDAAPPRLLVVDDVHLLDDASAALLLHLVATDTVRPIMTALSRAPLPDPITVLSRQADMEFLELHPLNRDDTAALASGVINGRLSDHTSIRIWELTAGNPRDTHELVRAIEAAGNATTIDDFVFWTGELPPSSRLSESVRSRLADIGPEARDALNMAALALPLGVRLIEELIDDGPLVELENARLVRRATPDASGGSARLERRAELELSSGLMAKVLIGDMPTIIATRHRRRIADVIAATGKRRFGDVIRVATLRLDADGTGHQPTLARASRRATLRYDNALGERLAAAALDAGGGPSAALALAFALNMQNRFEDAEQVLAKWWDDALDAEADDLVRQFVFQRVMTLHRGLGRLDEAERCVHEAIDCSTDPRWHQRVRGVHSYVESMVDLERGRELAEPLIDDPDCDALAAVYAIQAVATALNKRGMTDDALATIDPILPKAFSVRDVFPRAPGFVYGLRTASYLLAGRLSEVEAAVDKFMAQRDGGTDQQAAGAMLLTRGIVCGEIGQLDDAIAALERSLQHLNRSDPAVMRPRALTRLSIVRSQLGQVEQAASTLDTARSYLTTKGSNQVFLAELDEAEAWLAAARGDLGRAGEIALSGADRTALPVHQIFLAHAAHRFGVSPELTVEPMAVAGDMQAPLIVLHADRVGAAHTPEPGPALESVARRYADLGALVYAAESWVDASEAYRDDNTTASRRCAARAQDVLARVRPSRPQTPTLKRLFTPALTKRERRVGAAAARGLSNDEIATELGRSTRTVEWHLQNLYAKLAISSRHELDAIFDADGENGSSAG